jgi:hypothetical protein
MTPDAISPAASATWCGRLEEADTQAVVLSALGSPASAVAAARIGLRRTRPCLLRPQLALAMADCFLPLLALNLTAHDSKVCG